MGINKLNQLLKNQCPSVYKEVHLSEFAYKKVSIDVSLFMCKYKSIGESNWLESFLNLIVCLRRNDIHCVFIFDSGHPPEKVQEKEERTQAREKVKARNDLLDTLLTKYEETDELDPVLQDVFHKLDGINHAAIITNKEVLVKVLRTAIEKKKKAIFNITPEDWNELRHLFDTMNVVYYNAPLEAECMCADLCKRGLVDAALSEDTDVLAYGSPIFLTKIDIYKNTAVKIVYQEILQGLSLTSDQFLDLCIMCGTDYNKNIPKVGCETSYKYILTHGSIEEIAKQKNLDVSILNHIKSRDLFRNYQQYVFDDSGIRYNGQPQYDLLQEKGFNIERVKKCYKANIFFQI